LFNCFHGSKVDEGFRPENKKVLNRYFPVLNVFLLRIIVFVNTAIALVSSSWHIPVFTGMQSVPVMGSGCRFCSGEPLSGKRLLF
jgi:hypothetical protein